MEGRIQNAAAALNLIVDIGNTLVKLAVFDGGRIVAQRCVERLHPSMLGELLEAAGREGRRRLDARRSDDVVETVRPYADYLLEFTSQTPVPVPTPTIRPRRSAATGWPPPWAPRCFTRGATC